MELGQFQVYTGDGKGKTTAALGLALRASGAGLRVYFGQFIKRGAFSEIRALSRLEGVRVEQFGSGLGLLTRRAAQDADRRCAEEGYRKVMDALTGGEFDLVIADEIHCAMTAGLLTEAQLLSLAEVRPAGVELVFTGRGATAAILERADLVTEMRAVKHYYRDKKLPARTGIEM